MEFGEARRLTSTGIVPPIGKTSVGAKKEPICGGERRDLIGKRPARVFPKWEPGSGKAGGEAGPAAELTALVAQGRRDQAASPEFLDALEGLAKRWKAGKAAEPAVETPSDKLPMKADFRGEGWPAGWEAVRRDVWRFGDGEARQVESKADTRYVLFYEPGKDWQDYEVTFRFESDKWFLPPANSCAVLYFRYHATDDAYSLWLDGKGRLTVVSLDKGCGNRQRLLARVPLDVAVVKDGKPWTVKVHEENIEVWHEGERLLWTTDKAHRGGTVGLESVHIPMKFDGVEVK